MKKIHTHLYIIALILTMGLFMAAFIFSSYITTQKTEELKAIEDKIAIDILSFETQFDIIKESSCKTFDRSLLRAELDSLASKLDFLEGQVGADNAEVFRLKRYYSLLEIRDYLLIKRMNEQCSFNTIFILYFYSNKDCPTCQTQKYILRAIGDKYPEIEIYSFDYDIDLPALKTLTSLHNIPTTPPVIHIQDKAYGAFDSLESFEAVLKPILLQAQGSTTATTTKSKR